MLLVSIVILFVSEVLPRWLGVGDVAKHILGPFATPESVELFRTQLGLDEPISWRYVHWLAGSDWRASAYVGHPLERQVDPISGIVTWWADVDGTLTRWKMVDGEIVIHRMEPDGQVEKIEEVISFTVLEGDRVSVEVLKAKHDILVSLEETPDEAELAAIRLFENEIDEKRQDIFQEERFTRVFTQTHLIFAISVTVLAAGISLSGMSVVVNLKWLWYVGMAFGLLGLIGVILGIVSMLA